MPPSLPSSLPSLYLSINSNNYNYSVSKGGKNFFQLCERRQSYLKQTYEIPIYSEASTPPKLLATWPWPV